MADAEQDVLFEVASGPGRPVGKRLTLFDSGGRRAVYFGTTAIHVYDVGDEEAEAACIATLSRAGLATDVEIAAGFGVHRNTVGRIAGRFEREGMAAVVPSKRGPKGPFKVTPEVIAIVAADPTAPRRVLRDRIVGETGVSLSLPYLSQLAAAHRPGQQELVASDASAPDEGEGPAAMTGAGDGRGDDGAPGRDNQDGDQAERTTSTVFDPPPVLPARMSGHYMGLALYYPALVAVGLVDVARSLFHLPRSERFGVRAVFQTLFFMTLLSVATVESAKHLRRREFGAVAGTGRAPAVKTLRRKLTELVGQAKAAELGTALARRWVDTGMVSTAYLYVDGHVKAYTGKRRLQEVWNSQRRMPLPGVHRYFVGDGDGRPLLFVTEELSTNLAKAMPAIIAAIRDVVGDRPFTVVFDRGGYDGKLFAWLSAQKVSFITYQRGNPKLAADAFHRREARFEGRRVRFWLAEDEVKVGKSGPWRRVVVRTRDGHQTPILTSLGPTVGAARVACVMFARWRQENLFKYMGAHHGLDTLASYAAAPSDPDVQVPNPERKRLDRLIAEKRKQAAALRAQLGDALLNEPKADSRSAHGLKIAQRGAVGELRGLEAEIASLVAQRKPLPPRVAVSQSGTEREVMLLEHKAIIDRIKISAYNAEEWMLDRLVEHYRNGHDVRDLLRSFTKLSGEINTVDSTVVVSLDPPDTPLHRRALSGLVQDLNAIGATFPGTELPVTYRVAMHHSEQVA